MTSTRIPVLVAVAFIGALTASACNSRPAAPGGSASNLETCVYCHGTAGRVGNLPGTDALLPAAPPSAPNGKPAAVVGAHQVHVNPPIYGPLRAPIACNECHVVPLNLQHATNPPANPVQFGVLARAQGAAPTYEALSLGCSAVYCHGNFDFNGVKGKTASVVWDGGVVGCGACHDLPPTGHPTLTGSVTPATCSQCHPSTVNGDGSINVASGAHINGLADVTYSCTSCHGTAGRVGFQEGTDPNLASAPPVAPTGAPTHAVGAHQPHLNPPPLGSMRGPLPCAECHVVPTTPAHATTPPPTKVVFGTLATTQGATPTWTSTTTGCAATYCHGNFAFNGVTGANATPLWTGAQVTCVSCHAMPPAGHADVTNPVAASCAPCHPSTVNVNGSINLAGGAHLNGQADVLLDCTSCHGTAGRTGIQPGTDPQLASAPPVAPTGAPAHAVGAHLNHLNPPATGSFRGPVACAECHVVPTSSAHATTPPAQKVAFGVLATARGATPTWTSTTTGCAATYCHGAFDFNGVTGANGAPLWTGVGLDCTSCHAMPPAGHPSISGAVTAATCSQCHPSSVNANGTINLTTGTHLNGAAEVNYSCTACHGTPGRTGFLPGTDPQLAASPPFATASHPASAVGAHQLHVNPPSTGAFRSPLLCNECHEVPTDIAHATNPPASPVTFGALSRTQGNAPAWNGTTLSCSTTYCHGGFNFAGVKGASATPLWTDTNMQCVSCHGLPPSGHPALTPPVTAATCAQCHPSTVNGNGTINVATGAHVNGLANVAAGCTACHGTAGRVVPVGNPNALLPAAPPVAPPGSPPSVVGTHLLHLTDSTIRAAVNCNECHVIPDNPDHSIQFPPVIVFSPGTLATMQGAAPTYDATTLSCSATYCHGKFTFGGVTGNTAATPAWNVATPTLSCTGCHGMPPTGHQPVGTTVPAPATACTSCHSETVDAGGTIKVAGGKHMNGLAEYSGNHPAGWSDPTQHGYSANQQGLQNCTPCHSGFGAASGVATSSCNTCHANATHPDWQNDCTFCHGTKGRSGNVSGTDTFLAVSPPVGPQGQTLTTDAMVGAHQKHVNPPATGRVAQPFACVVCHATPLPANIDHVNGQSVPVPFGGVAITGNVVPTFNPVALSCSATYCHGNFSGGATTAAPLWTGRPMSCSSCHGLPPGTGEHGLSRHRNAGCGACHSGYSATAVNVTLHVNGVKNVGGPGTSINSWNASTLQCAPACHGPERW